MSIKTFIDRPILSVMLSVVIVIIGIIGLLCLPLEQYPDIAPPTVKVNATYVGANAETVMKSVVTPLEASINGVENMQYMTSTAANNGTCTITIYFKQGSDPNMAVVNVQNRVASAQGLLPAEVTKSGVTVRKTQNSNLKFITLYSPDGRLTKFCQVQNVVLEGITANEAPEKMAAKCVWRKKQENRMKLHDFGLSVHFLPVNLAKGWKK